MANFAKYPKNAMGHMLKHYERAKDKNGNYIKFGNMDINPKKTRYNYNLAPEHNQLEFVHQRMSEVRCLNRNNVNLICTWVVTKPKDLNPRQEKRFFQEVYAFLEAKYGKENVVSAYVHKDETTPHLHFCFLPVVPDPKRGGFKISAKECVKRLDLLDFHEQLQLQLEKKGLSCSVLNEATKEGNKAVNELKRGTAVQALKSLQEELEKENAILMSLKEEKRALEQEIEALKAQKNKIAKQS